MRCLILISVVCLQLGWSNGEPKGVGAVAYQDTFGRRYGGTYDLDDAQVNEFAGEFIPNFAQQPFQNFDDFFPEYFSNLENLLKDSSSRRASFRKARALDPLTSLRHVRPTRALFAPLPPLPPLRPFRPLPPLQPLPPLPPLRPFRPLPLLQPLSPLPPLLGSDRFNNRGVFPDFPKFGLGGLNMNAAFAGGAIGPGFTHQIAAISPQNPKRGNVDVVNRFADTGNPGFYSVQTSSFSSSSDVDGKKTNHRRAETVVNKDGQITAYKVES